MVNSVEPNQTVPIGAVCSGSTLFASILNSSVMFGNYLHQTTSADDIFRCIFSWRFKGIYISKAIREMIAKLMSMHCILEQGSNTNPLNNGSNKKEWTAAKATGWLKGILLALNLWHGFSSYYNRK